MAVLLDGGTMDGSALPWIGTSPFAQPQGMNGRDDACIEIGLVNNMPDGALQATEGQFIRLLNMAATRGKPLRIHLFSLPGIARNDVAAAHIRASYTDVADLEATRLDALIVTGCEPRAASLTDEPYWPALTRLADWAERHTVSTLWSCLAAHAAVLHLDGIPRHRLPTKRSGIFECKVAGAHPLLQGAPPWLQVPHSRWNDLREADLLARGYEVLTRSPDAGVNLFVKQRRSLFVFLQGHPEYDPDSIAKEYRRDVARYLRGEREHYPACPVNYFEAATLQALKDFEHRALADRESLNLRDMPRPLLLKPGLEANWQHTILPVFRNWLRLLDRKEPQRAPDASIRSDLAATA